MSSSSKTTTSRTVPRLLPSTSQLGLMNGTRFTPTIGSVNESFSMYIAAARERRAAALVSMEIAKLLGALEGEAVGVDTSIGHAFRINTRIPKPDDSGDESIFRDTGKEGDLNYEDPSLMPDRSFISKQGPRFVVKRDGVCRDTLKAALDAEKSDKEL
ncbi:hypothetical protein I302_106809 [Kwoniella bestiolae CBS 10118]|uniref:Uncharacterized protein n=1 Tax=Kwoniella bestiolae CBS 10118 TaxID=1296100 RepID=A0A1B9G0B6_9TREE|nr:hypothetical protein I302_05925 [Kwoniella bestiolae CBS 10118]OCF24465.1 hypothetical protein I302_05925 [Kwoniella bestiolae CBS 10118]